MTHAVPVPYQDPTLLYSVAPGLGGFGYVEAFKGTPSHWPGGRVVDGAEQVPICAAQYRAQSDGPAKIAELAKASSWERGSVVEKSGYALMPGSKTTDSDVARACAEMLATPPTPKV